MKDNKVTSIDLLKGKSYLTDLIAFFDNKMGSLHWGWAMAVTYLDFSKVFNMIPQQDRQTVRIWFGGEHDNIRWGIWA